MVHVRMLPRHPLRNASMLTMHILPHILIHMRMLRMLLMPVTTPILNRHVRLTPVINVLLNILRHAGGHICGDVRRDVGTWLSSDLDVRAGNVLLDDVVLDVLHVDDCCLVLLLGRWDLLGLLLLGLLLLALRWLTRLRFNIALNILHPTTSLKIIRINIILVQNLKILQAI